MARAATAGAELGSTYSTGSGAVSSVQLCTQPAPLLITSDYFCLPARVI